MALSTQPLLDAVGKIRDMIVGENASGAFAHGMVIVDQNGAAVADAGTSLDARLAQFEREVLKTYGDTVSITEKAKSLHKFGENDDIDVGTETIWHVGGDEVLSTTDDITHFSSSDASDTEDIIIEGHTVVGTGVNSVFTFVTQVVTLAGQTKVALTTPLARVSRVVNDNGNDLLGVVYIYEDVSVTAGVPASGIHLQTHIGTNNSEKAATTMAGDTYMAITGITAGVKGGTSSNVDVEIQICQAGKTFITKHVLNVSGGQGDEDHAFDPCLIVKKNADIRLRATSDTNNIAVNGSFSGYLAEVQ